MIRWPLLLAAHEQAIIGPEDQFDERLNGDPSSTVGEDDEAGFDDMPVENGWDDESDDEDDEDC